MLMASNRTERMLLNLDCGISTVSCSRASDGSLCIDKERA